jgi:hypothetical protein
MILNDAEIAAFVETQHMITPFSPTKIMRGGCG